MIIVIGIMASFVGTALIVGMVFWLVENIARDKDKL